MSRISLDPKTEKSLVKKIQKGSEKERKKALETIYTHYKKPIFRFFDIKIRITEDVEDLTATVFKKVLEGIDNFQWQGLSLSAWIYRIARNTLIDFFRENDKRRKTTPITDAMHLASNEGGPEEMAEFLDLRDQLHGLLEELPEREQKIIYMKFYEGYTNRTIARLTGLSETNVGTIVWRTVKTLRKNLEK